MIDAWMVSALAGVLGMMIGSFLNVCTFRWPEDESVVFPGSHCPKCGTAIRWYDNVPVIGYVLLGGRCRACRDSISLQYPLVELATGLVWTGMFSYAGLSFEALRGALLLTILFGIALTDARFYIIPDQFSLGGLVLGLGLSFLPGGIDPLGALLGAVLGSVIFGPISYKTQKLVPFGIFLAAGAALTYGFGSDIIEWYTTHVLRI